MNMNNRQEPENEAREVHEILKEIDPPGPAGARIPDGWVLRETGLHKWKTGRNGKDYLEHTTTAPFLISGRMKDLETGREWLELAYFREGSWRKVVVARETVMHKSKIIELAGSGFPVNTTNAKSVVDYLTDYEALNLSLLPPEAVSTHLGWQDGGKMGFLLGGLHMPGLTESTVRFQPRDDGDAQLSAGFATAGSFGNWLKAIEPIHKYPKVLAAFYAALAAPLLGIFDVHNFIIDLSSATSQGKTIALRVAASIWGNPDEDNKRSVLHSWDVTSNWLERTSGVLHSLPIFLDDTKRCKDEKLIAYMIYLVANGRGKGRATPKGTQSTGYWQTLLISTGETPITSYAERHGGAHARVLTLWGAPWEKQDAETGAMVNEIEAGVKENYGWAGRHFVDYLACMQLSKWNDWAEEYKHVRTEYEDLAKDNSVAFRMAGYFAALQIAAKLAHDVLRLPWDYDHALVGLNQVWNQVSREATSADRAKTALEYIRSWAYSNESQFVGRQNGNRHYQGSAGLWKRGEDWQSIAFYPHKLDEILKKGEFDWDAIKRSFRDRGWLDLAESERNERYDKKLRGTGGKLERLIVIRRSAFDQIEGDSPEAD